MALAWTDVDSGQVKSIAYHEDTETLCVKFTGGGLYSYAGVPEDIATDFLHANSVGTYLARVIKGTYPYTKYFSDDELLSALHED